MSKTILITETRLETVNYFHEFEGTIDQAKEWFQDNGHYDETSIESETTHSNILEVNYEEWEE
tara:strand:+ start:379 stop:567 length:189 start_codon:yes stop_codon:yes gene_type:complete